MLSARNSFGLFHQELAIALMLEILWIATVYLQIQLFIQFVREWVIVTRDHQVISFVIIKVLLVIKLTIT